MSPVLVALQDGEVHAKPELFDLVASALDVSAEAQSELLPSGKQTTLSNRVGWAITHMDKAGLLSRPARGQYAITERGTQSACG